ncbi:hypothetical protein B0H14DRAFT_3651161 [Mycena olivaceomarginata]|nr:hypothetical protein B0H14DRAFT_3651161 [Mycena olivaceomarginata]
MGPAQVEGMHQQSKSWRPLRGPRSWSAASARAPPPVPAPRPRISLPAPPAPAGLSYDPPFPLRLHLPLQRCPPFPGTRDVPSTLPLADLFTPGLEQDDNRPDRIGASGLSHPATTPGAPKLTTSASATPFLIIPFRIAFFRTSSLLPPPSKRPSRSLHRREITSRICRQGGNPELPSLNSVGEWPRCTQMRCAARKKGNGEPHTHVVQGGYSPSPGVDHGREDGRSQEPRVAVKKASFQPKLSIVGVDADFVVGGAVFYRSCSGVAGAFCIRCVWGLESANEKARASAVHILRVGSIGGCQDCSVEECRAAVVLVDACRATSDSRVEGEVECECGVLMDIFGVAAGDPCRRYIFQIKQAFFVDESRGRNELARVGHGVIDDGKHVPTGIFILTSDEANSHNKPWIGWTFLVCLSLLFGKIGQGYIERHFITGAGTEFHAGSRMMGIAIRDLPASASSDNHPAVGPHTTRFCARRKNSLKGRQWYGCGRHPAVLKNYRYASGILLTAGGGAVVSVRFAEKQPRMSSETGAYGNNCVRIIESAIFYRTRPAALAAHAPDQALRLCVKTHYPEAFTARDIDVLLGLELGTVELIIRLYTLCSKYLPQKKISFGFTMPHFLTF